MLILPVSPKAISIKLHLQIYNSTQSILGLFRGHSWISVLIRVE